MTFANELLTNASQRRGTDRHRMSGGAHPNPCKSAVRGSQGREDQRFPRLDRLAGRATCSTRRLPEPPPRPHPLVLQLRHARSRRPAHHGPGNSEAARRPAGSSAGSQDELVFARHEADEVAPRGGRTPATHSAIRSGTRRDGLGHQGTRTPPMAAPRSRGTWIRALTTAANQGRPHSRTVSAHA
jgi:hypothetical protein